MHIGIYSLYNKIKASTKIQRTRLQPETPDTIFNTDSFKTEAGPWDLLSAWSTRTLASESNQIEIKIKKNNNKMST